MITKISTCIIKINTSCDISRHIYLWFLNQHRIYALDIPVVSDINHTLRKLQYWAFNLYRTYPTLMHRYFNDMLKLLKHNKCHHTIKKIEKKLIFLITFASEGAAIFDALFTTKAMTSSKVHTSGFIFSAKSQKPAQILILLVRKVHIKHNLQRYGLI